MPGYFGIARQAPSRRPPGGLPSILRGIVFGNWLDMRRLLLVAPELFSRVVGFR